MKMKFLLASPISSLLLLLPLQALKAEAESAVGTENAVQTELAVAKQGEDLTNILPHSLSAGKEPTGPQLPAPPQPPSPGTPSPTPPPTIRWTWVDGASGQYLPPNAIFYGDAVSRSYVCAVWFQNEWSVGKYVGGNCNFSWRGTEWTTNRYKVLVGSNVYWSSYSSSSLPPSNGVYVYSLGSYPVYVCGVYYGGIYQTGKVINNRCSLGYNGFEYVFDSYQIAFYL